MLGNVSVSKETIAKGEILVWRSPCNSLSFRYAIAGNYNEFNLPAPTPHYADMLFDLIYWLFQE